MSKMIFAKCSNFFVIAFIIIFIHFCTSAPVVNVTENAYTQFIAELNSNKCSVPSQVQLPFDSTKANNFEFLSSFLGICQKTGSTKRNKEAVFLCKEIFDNVRNISCPMKTALPDISVPLSENVCRDIGALKDSVPEDDESLLKRLSDTFLCEMMCDSEFEKSCQVLLWSFDVRKQIASVASAQEPIQPNLQEDGEDMNAENIAEENVLPEGSVNLESEKKNAIESKDANEVVGQDRITEEAEPSKMEDNLEEKTGTLLLSDKIRMQEKPVSNDKVSVPKDQPVHVVKSQDSTDPSKSTSNTKTPSSPIQQKPDVEASNSNIKIRPEEKMRKSESNNQNTNQLPQGDITMPDKVNSRDELPQTSDPNVATHEQTQDVKANTFVDRADQYSKDPNILADGHAQDNSDIPAKQSIQINGENTIPSNEIPGETPEKVDKNSGLLNNNDLPHGSANNAAADLHTNEQKPSNLVHSINQSEVARNDGRLADKMNYFTTNSQTTQDLTLQQTILEENKDKTKADQPLTNSDSTKIDTQDSTNTNQIITEDRTKNLPTDKTKTKVDTKIEELDNTIPDTKGTSVITDEKPPEKSQKLKPTAVDADAKSVVPSSLTETSTKVTVALEKMEGGSDLRPPPDEEADHYGDQENTEDEDYNKREYDGFYEVSKNKESNPDISIPSTAARDKLAGQNERPIEFPSRNAFGQDSSSIQMISTFPEQEDSHFFFYFLSIVLILMAGYLLFHNKQKIIALIVEGRHERNRRSHRVGYKKLETK